MVVVVVGWMSLCGTGSEILQTLCSYNLGQLHEK